MPLPDKLDNLANNQIIMSDDEDDYEILPEKEVKGLRDELKKVKECEVSPSRKMYVAINELNSKLDRLIAIFDEANKELKVEEGGLSFQEKMRPLAEKMNKILEQNSEIAEGIVAIADIVKDFRTDLETKGVTVSEKVEPIMSVEPPQSVFPAQRPFEPQPLPPRIPLQQPNMPIQRLAPLPFEAPRPPTGPPPMSPPKKRLFGI